MSYFSHILVHQNQGSRLKWFINHTPRFVTFKKTRIAINQNIVIFMGSINLKQYSLAKEMVKRYDLRYSTGCQEKNSPLTQYSMVDCPFFLPHPVYWPETNDRINDIICLQRANEFEICFFQVKAPSGDIFIQANGCRRGRYSYLDKNISMRQRPLSV